jgi:hypothetical protein
MKIYLGRLMIIVLIVLVSGCGGINVKKEAFAKPKTFAIVTVGGSVHGIYSSDAEDIKILAESAPICMTELAKSRNFRLLPAKSVLTSKAYTAIKNEGPMMMSLLASGYKRFTPEDEKLNLKALAKETHADGFLIMSFGYAKSESSLGIMGVSLGSVKPALTYVVMAVNTEGEVIWNDVVSINGEEGIHTVMGIGGYSSLIPKLNVLTRTACQQSVKNLADQIAAK